MRAWKLGGGLVIGTSLLLAVAARAPLQEGQPLEAVQAAQPAAGPETGIYVSPAGLAHVQRRLNEAGYAAGHVDRIWGLELSGAVARSHRDRALDATGTLTIETIHALDLGGRLTGEGVPEPVAAVGPLEEAEQRKRHLGLPARRARGGSRPRPAREGRRDRAAGAGKRWQGGVSCLKGTASAT